MPTIARSYSIEYGTTVIGGTSDKFYLRKRGFGYTESYRRGSVTFEVVVRGDTVSAFKDNQQELLVAFRTIRQRLQVKTPDGLLDYNPSASINTGFNQEPSIEVVQTPFNGPKFKNYRCTVSFDLPADLASQAGRRDNSVAISGENNKRRTYTFTGTYTALATNNATAQYTAAVATYEATQLPGGSTWQLLTTRTSVDDTDKILEFTRVHEEITVNQAIGTPSHASVIKQWINVKEVESGVSGQTFINNVPAVALVSYDVTYKAIIDIEQTPSTGLKALYDATLKPHVINELNLTYSVSPTANGSSISNDTSKFDLDNNIIEGSFVFQTLGSSNVIESKMTKQLVDTSGLEHTPVSTGQPHHYAEDSGPPERILRVTVMEKRKAGAFFEYKAPQNYSLLKIDESGVEEVQGNHPNTLKFKRRTKLWEYRYVLPYIGGGSGSGGGAGGGGGRRIITSARGPSGLPGGLRGLNNFNGNGI